MIATSPSDYKRTVQNSHPNSRRKASIFFFGTFSGTWTAQVICLLRSCATATIPAWPGPINRDICLQKTQGKLSRSRFRLCRKPVMVTSIILCFSFFHRKSAALFPITTPCWFECELHPPTGSARSTSAHTDTDDAAQRLVRHIAGNLCFGARCRFPCVAAPLIAHWFACPSCLLAHISQF